MNHEPCPFCGTLDHVQTIRGVFNDGLTVTSGSAVTLDPSSGRFLGTFYSSETRSDLCKRLNLPTRPGSMSTDNFVKFYLLSIVLLTIGFKILVFTSPDANFLVWSITVFLAVLLSAGLGILVSPIFMVINYIVRSEARIHWQNLAIDYAESLYCHQDDVVFDNVNWGRPEDYVQYFFSK